MTACLRCDGCGKVSAEHEDDLRKWWRIARHGVEWADEPSEPRNAIPSFSIHSVLTEVRAMEAEMDDEELISSEFGMSTMDDEPLHVLHFCNSRCLGSWADQTASLEDSMGDPP